VIATIANWGRQERFRPELLWFSIIIRDRSSQEIHSSNGGDRRLPYLFDYCVNRRFFLMLARWVSCLAGISDSLCLFFHAVSAPKGTQLKYRCALWRCPGVAALTLPASQKVKSTNYVFITMTPQLSTELILLEDDANASILHHENPAFP
jgi:hypothetical protein